MSPLRAGLLLASLSCCAKAPPQVPPQGPLDAIVVLGHRPSTSASGLAYEARARVEEGIERFLGGSARLLVFSGGPAGKGVVEADAMAEHAMRRGVPADAILRERVSEDTIDNARLSVAMLRARLGGARRPHVLLVTSDYHSPRAARLFRCAGADVVSAPVLLTLSPRERARRERTEWFIGLYYWFIDECKRASR